MVKIYNSRNKVPARFTCFAVIVTGSKEISQISLKLHDFELWGKPGDKLYVFCCSEIQRISHISATICPIDTKFTLK